MNATDKRTLPSMGASSAADGRATGLGVVSVLLWGTSIAVTRLITESLGPVRGPFFATLASGLAGLLVLVVRRGELAMLRKLPPRYWLVCGGLFVSYILSVNLGIGLAHDTRQLLIFSVLNYLWPGLTVVFSALLFKRRVRSWLGPGLLLALAGIVLAFVARPTAEPGEALSLAWILRDIRGNPAVYLLGLYCGVSWGLYSNLGRKIVGSVRANPVPLLFLASSALLGVALGLGAESPVSAARASWSVETIGALLYRALVVDLLAYILWDAAMRRGNQIFAAAASFLTPLLSTASISILLGVAPGWLFWVACLLSVCGAVVCKISVPEPSR